MLETVRMHVCVRGGGRGCGGREARLSGPLSPASPPLTKRCLNLDPPHPPPSTFPCLLNTAQHRQAAIGEPSAPHTHTHTEMLDSIMLSEYIDGYGYCVLITLRYLCGE